MSFFTQARSELAALKARAEMVEGRVKVMLNVILAFLANVKAAVENILAQFPTSGVALATLAAWLLTRFGFHATVGTVETIVGAVLALVSALTAHSVKKARLAAAAK